MNSGKLKMDEENSSKTESQKGVCKLFHQHYYDLLWQSKMVKVGQENIITSYYQIIEVLKSVLRIRQQTGSKHD